VAAEAPERLSFDDARILQLESASILGHTCKLIVVEPDATGRAVGIAELREQIGARLDGVPRLRQRVVFPADHGAAPFWEDDPGFDLANHIGPVEVERPLDADGFRKTASELMGERLDHERPLWRLDVMPLEGGRTGVVGRFHHCMADGVSVMRMLSAVLWDPAVDKGEPAAPATPDRAEQSPDRQPVVDRARAAARLPGTLSRELRPGGDSPLDRHIGKRRELAWTSFPLSELRRIEHAAGPGVTINDVVLAAIAGALGRWLQSVDAPPTRLRAKVPVSLHARDESAGQIGNRDSFLFVDLPIAEPDPQTRLGLINDETRERKLDHDAETLYSFFHALGRFRPLQKGVTRLTDQPREFALSVSNVPGPREPVHVSGRPVSEFCSFAEPADRHALRVAVVSLAGTVAFGLCSDPDAVGSLDTIADALTASVAELAD
jgi:WS/DGAT/MGAT family acyltransferase